MSVSNREIQSVLDQTAVKVEQIRARPLRFILLFFLFIGTVITLESALYPPAYPYFYTNLIFLGITLFGLYLYRNHSHRLTSIYLCTFLFVNIAYTMVFIDESVASATVMGFFVLIPLTTLLLGKRTGNLFLAGSVGVITLVFMGGSQRWLMPTTSAYTYQWGELFFVMGTLIIVTVLQNTNMRLVGQVTADYKRRTVELLETNSELEHHRRLLEASQHELEERVYKRTAELHKSETRYRTLVENAPEALLIYNADRHQITEANRRAVEMFGYSRIDLLNLNPTRLLPDRDENDPFISAEQIKRIAAGEEVLFEAEYCSQTNQIIVGETRLVRLPGHDDAAVRCSIFDITARKETEQRLREAEEMLHMSQKTESLGVLAGGIAHDFNNLLVGIIAQQQVAQHKLPADHVAAHHLEKANRAARQAATLTRQLLDYAGRGQSQVQIFDLNHLISENMHLLQLGLPEGATFAPHLRSHLPPIRANAGQMQQIIMNLLINAVDAIPNTGGQIKIMTDVWTVTEADSLSAYISAPSPGRYVTLTVKDNGRGIEPEQIRRIFDPFFTTKTHGRGLGLSAVLGIVRSHQGGLWLTSRPGEGTTFRLLFPEADTTSVSSSLSSE